MDNNTEHQTIDESILSTQEKIDRLETKLQSLEEEQNIITEELNQLYIEQGKISKIKRDVCDCNNGGPKEYNECDRSKHTIYCSKCGKAYNKETLKNYIDWYFQFSKLSKQEKTHIIISTLSNSELILVKLGLKELRYRGSGETGYIAFDYGDERRRIQKDIDFD